MIRDIGGEPSKDTTTWRDLKGTIGYEVNEDEDRVKAPLPCRFGTEELSSHLRGINSVDCMGQRGENTELLLERKSRQRDFRTSETNRRKKTKPELERKQGSIDAVLTLGESGRFEGRGKGAGMVERRTPTWDRKGCHELGGKGVKGTGLWPVNVLRFFHPLHSLINSLSLTSHKHVFCSSAPAHAATQSPQDVAEGFLPSYNYQNHGDVILFSSKLPGVLLKSTFKTSDKTLGTSCTEPGTPGA